MRGFTVLRTLGAFAIVGLATQSLAIAVPQPVDTAALDKRLSFTDVEQFTKSFFTSFFKRDLEVRSTQSSTDVMNNALSHLNHTVAQIKAAGPTNSSAALLASSLAHMKSTITAKLSPAEQAAFAAAAKNFTIPAPGSHQKRDASKDGTIAGDAASFFQHAASLLGGLFESAEKRDVEKRDASKDGTIAGDAASFFQHVRSIFSGLFESVE
jgi:hypothetical protein